MTPQILIIVLFSISLLLAANKHGREKSGKENFWTSLVAMAITVGLLIWGGFFDNLFK